MNKNLLIVLVVIVLLGIFYFSRGRTTQLGSPTQTSETQDAAPEVKRMTVVLEEQNESGESGTAVLEEIEGKLLVTLKLAGAPEEISQPTHIHAGNCPDVGAVVYPLGFAEDGDSETDLEVSFLELEEQMPLAINVHKSTPEAKVYVSCGDLIF